MENGRLFFLETAWLIIENIRNWPGQNWYVYNQLFGYLLQ